MHAFARHPSGSRPGAPGARLPNDRLVLDPRAPKPPGPAIPQAQIDAPVDLGGGPQREDPLAGHPSASAPARAGQHTPPAPEGPVGPEDTELAYSAQDGAHSGPRPGAGGSLPSGLHVQQGLEDARATARGSQGIRAILGLGPGGAQPDGRPGAVKAGRAGKPAKARAKRAPNGPASQRARKSSSLQAPQEIPRATSSIGSRARAWALRQPQLGPTGHRAGPLTRPLMPVRLMTGMPLRCRRPHGAPQEPLGARLTPPPDGRRPGAGGPSFLVPGSQGTSHRSPGGARRATPVSGCGSRDHQSGGGWSPIGGSDAAPGRARRMRRRAHPRACATSRICSCLSPVGEDDRSLPRLAGGARDSWSLIRPPAVRSAAHFLPDSRDSEVWSLSL